MPEKIKAGMHDIKSIYPRLPGITPSEAVLQMLKDRADDEWRTCWEYKLTHAFTEMEGSAFWHGADLAMGAGLKAGWQQGHDAVCPQGQVCSAHQPPENFWGR